MSENKVYFFTYGDEKYTLQKKHICNLAKLTNRFNNIHSFSPKDIDPSFIMKFKKVLDQPIGGGYYLWKFYFLRKLISEINNDDIVFYLDAGSSVNYKASKRIDEYIDIVNSSSSGKLSFSTTFMENQYTTKEVFKYFNIDPYSKIGTNNQLMGGLQIIKKNNSSISLLEDFNNLMLSNMHLITDKYNNQNQIKEFKTHRHDQSIFSILSKIYESTILPDETFFSSWEWEKQYKYPFLTVRKRNYRLKEKLKFYSNYKKNLTETIFFE
jgi:hypothetical protein